MKNLGIDKCTENKISWVLINEIKQYLLELLMWQNLRGKRYLHYLSFYRLKYGIEILNDMLYNWNIGRILKILRNELK